MNEDRLRRLLREHPVPEPDEAEQRAWRVARAAFEEQADAARVPARPRARLALALGAAIVLAAALALSPAGAKVGDLIGDVVDPGRERAEPVLTELPTAGWLLVESEQGPWIVHRDGSKRLLGDYDEATWSPRGLFVAAARGRELVAVVADSDAVGQPAGTVRWTLSRNSRVSDPTWTGPELASRIAYRSGNSLRVVAGDGTDDRLVDERVAPVPPAWRPGADHRLAYVDRAGHVRLVDADTGRPLWSSGRFTNGVTGLDWSADGNRLLVVTESFVVVLDRIGTPVAKGATSGGATAAAFSPRGDRIALVRSVATAKAGRSELVLLDGDQGGERRLLAGPGRFTDVVWSPNGDWLLLPWRDADQWLFVRPRDEQPEAVSNISRQFDPGGARNRTFPRVGGWCCSR